MHSPISLCTFIPSPTLTQSLTQLLSSDRYSLKQAHSDQEFIGFIEQNKEKIDCLIILYDADVPSLLNLLYEQGILLPVIIITDESSVMLSNKDNLQETDTNSYLYHSGEVKLLSRQIGQIGSVIDRAISQFLHLGPSCALGDTLTVKPENKQNQGENQQNFLLLQQRRLAEKLKERLGYLGVYYKRNPQYFYRHLSSDEKKELLDQLNTEYRQIILNYFADTEEVNQAIDQFVNRCFFADISVSQILELHMELMDEFSQQLKLEGRSEEILLDYRLALIDIIAHLCEMYRRSIPREDLPFEILFPLD